ncbi:MAG: hypothetical protein E7Z81_09710 [Methanobrevibacter sp.]|jgi:hypothetical protein|uniref:hypothetical protein n=1 Tax=Methanobrevibacter sp. TaxID=66852 RepID=UPI0025DAFEE1|nr:hypothetical protein [Methanobrevibacter sp.]MBE6498526.1 hypothetical protein [Methanobrevibacter sp.]
MVNLSVIVSTNNEDIASSMDIIRSQSLDDIEVICIDEDVNADGVRTVKGIDEIAGKYVYFMNAPNGLDKNTFKEAFDMCEDKNLDFLQLTDEFESEVCFFNEFKARTFKMDISRDTKFISTRLLKRIGEISPDDYLLFWDCIFNCQRFSFYGKNINIKRPELSYDDKVNLINSSNMVFTKFTDHNFIGKYKFKLFDWRIELLYSAWKSLDDDLRQSYYEALKEDFTQMIYHWRFTDFAEYVNPINKLFFDDIVYSKTYEDFEKLMVQYDIQLDSEEFKKENQILEKNIKILKKENESIFNSTSWKITKPLRGLK